MRASKRWMGSVAAVALLAGVSAPVSAQDVVEGPAVAWEVSLWGPPRAFTMGLEHIRDVLAERTDGNFELRLHYAEAISPSRENLDGLQVGAFEMAQICAFYHPGKNPALTGLDLPFLPIPDLDVKQAVTEAYFQHPAIVEELARWDALLLFDNLLPQYEFFGVGAPPRELEDWSGKRVRAPGGIGEAMSLLGAVPTTVPAPEVYTSAERGLIDAASFPYTYSHIAYGMHEISDWHTANMAPGSATCPTVVAITAWEALPEQYRDLFEETIPEAMEVLKEAYAEADAENFPLMEEHGLEPIEYSEEQLARFREIGASPVWEAWIEEMEGQGIPGRELVDLILDAADKAMAAGG
jgi:TRAP-type mannitol/chloroaromatic compound transport system substrate-binding protein